MTLTIVATAGATDANAYATLAEVETYVTTMSFSTAWIGKTDEQKKAAIIQAARWLDTLEWAGMRSSQTQALAWPRCEKFLVRFVGISMAGSGYLLDRDGYQIASDTIPTCIKNANAEMAVRQLASDWTQGLGPITQDSIKVGPISQGRKSHRPIPAAVLAFVGQFLTVSPNTGGRLVRG